MAFEFKLPDIGEGVVEGEIVKWLVKPGDRIELDQPMVEVMTDKATVVIPSPKAGVVLETRGKEGEVAKVHSVLVVIDERGAQAAAPLAAGPRPAERGAAERAGLKASSPPAQARSDARAEGGRPTVSGAPLQSPREARGPIAVTPPPNGRGNNGERAPEIGRDSIAKVLAAPATRRLARELGVDLVRVGGTGPAGRVTSEDVRRAADGSGARVEGSPSGGGLLTEDAERRAPSGLAPAAHDERIPVRGLRRRIWENMTKSAFTAAHFTFVEECDATELVRIRDRFNAGVPEGEEKITFLPFIVKAVIVALKRFPDLNAHVDDQAMEHIRRAEYHIGIAAASERGLVVPVVRNADRLTMIDIASEIRRLAEATRSGRLEPRDLGGSTFTITSLGKDGGIFATPIINYPEVAIMGVHKISKRPVVVNDEIVIRDRMNLSLSFDHRLIDGHVGAAFTYAVIRLLERPERLMMEMA